MENFEWNYRTLAAGSLCQCRASTANRDGGWLDCCRPNCASIGPVTPHVGVPKRVNKNKEFIALLLYTRTDGVVLFDVIYSKRSGGAPALVGQRSIGG